MVNQKFEELKKAKTQAGGRQFIGDADAIPSDQEVPSGWRMLKDEEDFYGHITWE